MRIPSENLFFVLCYAWERLDRLKAAPKEATKARYDLPQNLLGRILHDSVARVLRRGLDRGYRGREEDTRRPRGKLDLASTVHRTLHLRGQVRVRYQELSRDVLHNRIVRTTMLRLAAIEEMDRDTKEKLTQLVRRIGDVGEVDLREASFRQVRIHRNNAEYGFLLDLCRLIARQLVPDENTGATRFRDFTTEDEGEWGLLFEGFVRGFLRIEHSGLEVDRRVIGWGAPGQGAAPRLPQMKTDIFVPSDGGRSVIVETKCVKSPFAEGPYASTKAVRTDHLYQLFAYLRNHAESHPNELPALGVLLYATNGEAFDHCGYDLHGHPLRVSSVDLGKPWPSVVEDLNRLAADFEEEKSARL